LVADPANSPRLASPGAAGQHDLGDFIGYFISHSC